MYQRLTTDDAQDNLHILFNYAYDHNKEVYLRWAGGREAVPLAQYVAMEAGKRGCDVERDDVMTGDACLDCEDCPLAVLNAVAAQAAELRARLKQFEDIGLSPKELAKAAELARMLEDEAKERAEAEGT